MKSIDGKSVIIGLLAGVCLMLIVGQSGVSYGSFQLAVGGEDDSIPYIMNTDTGELWSRQYNAHESFGTPHNPKYEHTRLNKKIIKSEAEFVHRDEINPVAIRV